MQHNRNKYLLVSFIFLTIVSAALYFLSRGEAKPVVNKDLFSVDTDKINAVTLQSPKATVQLKFVNNQWKVNDKWVADAGMIKVLFATLKQVEPRRPIAALLKDSVRNILQQNGVKISLSGADGADVFYAGGNTLKTETWFMKADDPQPYTMVIPGYRVYVAGILELDESGWRNKRIFDFNWRNFKSLTSTYQKDQKQSFEIVQKDGFFGIKEMTLSDTTKVNDYLDAVSLLFASRFVLPGQHDVDSLIATPPAIRIEIKDIANRSFTLDLFTPRRKDSEVFGKLGDGQVVAIQKNDVGNIVRNRDYFLPKSGK